MSRRSNDLNNSSKRALRRNRLIVQGLNQSQTLARQSSVGHIVQRRHPNGVARQPLIGRHVRRIVRAPLIEKIVLTRVQLRRMRDTWWKPRGLRPFSVSLFLCRLLLPVPLLLFLLYISGPREKALKPENLIFQ